MEIVETATGLTVVMNTPMAAKVTNTAQVVLVTTPFVAVVGMTTFMVAVVMTKAMAAKVTTTSLVVLVRTPFLEVVEVLLSLPFLGRCFWSAALCAQAEVARLPQGTAPKDQSFC